MNTLHDAIPDILHYLFVTYGDSTPEELSTSAELLKAKAFDITQPLIVMYNEVQDLQDIATAANNSFSDTQIVNLAIQLIKNMCDFEKSLIDWYARPIIEHTWLNFQTHFEDSHQTLRKLRELTM